MNSHRAETARPYGEGGLENTRVSTASVFCDNLWLLDDPNPAKAPSRRKIDWRRDFGKHGCLTDEIYVDLLRTSKMLVYDLMHGKGTRGTISAASAVTVGSNLIALLAWMVKKGLRSFVEIDTTIADEYFVFLEQKQGSFSRKAGRRLDGGSDDKLRDGSVYARLTPLRYISELAEEMDDPRYLPKSWFQSRISRKNRELASQIPRIPDDVAYPLYREALRWIVENGEAIIAVNQRRHDVFAEREVTARERKQQMRNVLLSAGEMIQINGNLVPIREFTAKTFSRLVTTLETACYIVIAGFSGMRVSEISGLDVDCARTQDLDGQGIFILCSDLVKTAVGGTEKRLWIAGLAELDNPVQKAVCTMLRLRERERRISGFRNLFGAFAVVNAPTHRVSTLSESVVNRRLNEFTSYAGLDGGWHLSTHQFRKSFAHMVVYYHSCPVLALKRHFKHVSIQMTDFYIGTDNELLDLVLGEQEELLCSALHAVLDSTHLAGKLGERILANNVKFRGQAGSAMRSEYIASIIGNTDVTVLPHEYGICIMFIETARCGGDRDRVGLSTCVGCSNFIVTPEHASYWKQRITDLEHFKADVSIVDLGADQESAIERAKTEAESILHAIQE